METVVLRERTSGTFAVPEEWTDLAAPRSQQHTRIFFDFLRLLELTELVSALSDSQQKELDA